MRGDACAGLIKKTVRTGTWFVKPTLAVTPFILHDLNRTLYSNGSWSLWKVTRAGYSSCDVSKMG